MSVSPSAWRGRVLGTSTLLTPLMAFCGAALAVLVALCGARQLRALSQAERIDRYELGMVKAALAVLEPRSQRFEEA